MFSEAVFCAEPALPIIVPPVSYHYNAVAGFAPALGLLSHGMAVLHAMSEELGVRSYLIASASLH